MITSAKIIDEGVSYEVYSSQPPGVIRGDKSFIMSRGELVNFAVNPKRWLDGYREDEADTDATRWGNLVECMAGLSGNFDDLHATAPAEYKDEKTGVLKPWNWNATVCKTWREEQGDREVIKPAMRAKAEAAVAALEDDPDVFELFECSRKQVMVVGNWNDKATGLYIPIRALLDLVPNKEHPVWGKTLADFKTCRNGSPDVWARVSDDSGYDVQAALFRDLYITATGEDRTDWIHVVQENVHPYHVTKPFPALSAEFMAFGRAKYQIALREYAQCLASGIWPSYSTGNRLVIGATQLISPDSLWKYRETGGAVASRQDYTPEPKEEREPQGITP